MGDPKRIRKKYQTPRHPWVGSRIEEERELRREYGLRNKQEIWKMGTQLTRFKDRAKKLLARTDAQAKKEERQFIERMVTLGLLKQGATFDDILGLGIKNVMDRRLQTILIKKLLARTPKQARQMITHRHIAIGGKVITSPSYLVTMAEEPNITFVGRSAFINDAHPERFSEEELMRKKQKEEAKKQKAKAADEPEAATFDPAAIEQAEVLAGEKKVESAKEAVKEAEKSKEAAEKSVSQEKKSPKEKQEAPKEAAPEKKEEPKEEKPEEKPAEPAPEQPAEEKKEGDN